MAIAQVSVAPVGTGTTSLSEYVALALKVLDTQTSVKYRLTPMGTVLEGDLDQILAVIRQMHESVFDGKIQRAVTTISIDDRRDKPVSMDDKVSSVQCKL